MFEVTFSYIEVEASLCYMRPCLKNKAMIKRLWSTLQLGHAASL